MRQLMGIARCLQNGVKNGLATLPGYIAWLELQQYLTQRKDRSAGASMPEEKRQRREHRNKKNYPQFDVRKQT